MATTLLLEAAMLLLSQMNSKLFLRMITTLSVTCAAPARAAETEILPQCPAGSYLSQSSPEKCLACKGGATYMDRPNREHSCNPCTKCDGLMTLVTPCSVTADAQCECYEGYFKNVEGKCSPKAIWPVASTVSSYVDRKTDVGSSSPIEKTEYQLDVVIGIIITAVVLIALKIVIDIVWRCHQQKRARTCTMGCSLMKHRGKEPGTSHSKQLRGYERTGQVADDTASYVLATRKEEDDKCEHSERQGQSGVLDHSSITFQPLQAGYGSTSI